MMPVKKEKTESLHDESPFKNPALQRRRPTGFERPRLDQDSFISEASATEKMPEGLPMKSSKDRIKWSDSVQELGEPLATSNKYGNLPKMRSSLTQSELGETLQPESQKVEEPLRERSSMESSTERVKRSESIPRYETPKENHPEHKGLLTASSQDSKVRSAEPSRERFSMAEDFVNKTQQRSSIPKHETPVVTPECEEPGGIEIPESEAETYFDKSPNLEKAGEVRALRTSAKSNKLPQESLRQEYLAESPSPKSKRFSLVKVDLSNKVDASRFSVQQNAISAVGNSADVPDVVRHESYEAAKSQVRSHKGTERLQSEEPARCDESEQIRTKLPSRTRESCTKDHSGDVPDAESHGTAKSQSHSHKGTERLQSNEPARYDEGEQIRTKLPSRTRESCARDHSGDVPGAARHESHGAEKSQARPRKGTERLQNEEPARYDECEQIRRKLLTPRPRECCIKEQYKARMHTGDYGQKTGRIRTTPRKAHSELRERSGPGKCRPARLLCEQTTPDETSTSDEDEETEQSASSESSGVKDESSSQVSVECRETEKAKTASRGRDKMPCKVEEQQRSLCKKQSIIKGFIFNTPPRHSYKFAEHPPKVEESDDEINTIIACPQAPYLCQYPANTCCYCFPSCAPNYHVNCIPLQPCNTCGTCRNDDGRNDPMQVNDTTCDHMNPAAGWNGDGDSDVSSESNNIMFQAPKCNTNSKHGTPCHNFNWHNAQKNIKNSAVLYNTTGRFDRLKRDVDMPLDMESRIVGKSRRERVSFELLNSKNSKTLQTEDASTNEPKVCYINLDRDKIDVASKLRELEEICSFNSLTNVCANNNNLDDSEQLNNDLDSKLNASENNSNIHPETKQDVTEGRQSSANSSSECNIDLSEILDRHNCLTLPPKGENNVSCKMEYFPDDLDSQRQIVYADMNVQTDDISSGNSSDIAFGASLADDRGRRELNEESSPQNPKSKKNTTPDGQAQRTSRMRNSLVKRTLEKFRIDNIFNRAHKSHGNGGDRSLTSNGRDLDDHRLIKIPNDHKRGVFSMLQPGETFRELTLCSPSKRDEDPGAGASDTK